MCRAWRRVALLGLVLPAVAGGAAPDTGLGINLHSVNYWSPAIPFANVFRQAGAWIPQREGSSAWNTGEPLQLDRDGWIRSLAPGQQAAVVIMAGTRFPAGRYLVSHDGRGELFAGLDARVVAQRGGDLVLEVRPKHRTVLLKLLRTDPADPLRNLRVMLPGFNPAAQAEDFNPAFLEHLRGFRVLRFMDWANANQDDTVHWSQRTRPAHASQERRSGVALETMIGLAERLGAVPWFTIPHAASDDYVRRAAALIGAGLARGRKFYLEYSNEVWNTQFPQAAYAAAQAARLGLADADAFYLRRSLEVFRLFEDVLGGDARMVRVLSGQAVNLWRARRLLQARELRGAVDAYAIAPYFGDEGQLRGAGPGALDPARASLAEVMLRLGENVAATRAVVRANVVLAAQAGLPLIAYEGGQHVTNGKGYEALCAAANRDPRMADLYTQYLEMWREETAGALMVLFADLSTYGSGGCWGLAEHLGQDPAAAPKLAAARAFLQGTGDGRR